MKKYLYLFILLCSFSVAKAQLTDSLIEKSTPVQSPFGDKIFSAVDTMPEFPGGIDSLKKYLSKNIVYPIQLLKNKTGGIVVLYFVVEKDGSLSGIRVGHSPDEKLSEEAIKVIRSVKYINASQSGYPARIAYSMRIAFDPEYPYDH